MANRFTISGYQEQGGRSYQEDRYYSDSMVLAGTKVFVLAVADGMGGHKAGDIASELAIKEVRKFFSNFEIANFQDLKAALYDVFRDANHAIRNHSKIDHSAAGLGTTLTCAVIIDHKMIVAHIGDSRAFIVTDDDIFQCTRDHTAYQEALDSGVDVSKINVGASALTRCLDGGDDYEPDLSSVYNVEQTLVFLCSDGLYNAVSAHNMENIARESADSNVFSRWAVKRAVENGAGDNVSVVTFADSERSILPVGTLTTSNKKQKFSVIKAVVLVLILSGITMSGFGLYSYLGTGDENEQITETPPSDAGSNGLEPNDEGGSEAPAQSAGSNQSDDGNIQNDVSDEIEAELVDLTFDLYPPDTEVIIENKGMPKENDDARQSLQNGRIRLQQGSYVAYMTREGYRSDEIDFEVVYPQDDTIIAELQKMEGYLDLTLLPANAGANISIVNEETGTQKDLETGLLPSTITLPPGDYTATISSELYKKNERIFSITDEETTELSIELEKNVSPSPDTEQITEEYVQVSDRSEETTDGDDEVIKDDTVKPEESVDEEELPYYVILFSTDPGKDGPEKYQSEIQSSIGSYTSQIHIVEIENKLMLVVGPYDSEENAENAKKELGNMLQDRIDEDENLRPWKKQIDLNQ